LEPTPLVRIEKLAKIYRSGEHDLAIFRDLDLTIETGDQVAVIGESRAGWFPSRNAFSSSGHFLNWRAIVDTTAFLSTPR